MRFTKQCRTEVMEFLEAFGMKNSELAQAAGIGDDSIGRWLRGPSSGVNIRLATWRKVTTAMDRIANPQQVATRPRAPMPTLGLDQPPAVAETVATVNWIEVAATVSGCTVDELAWRLLNTEAKRIQALLAAQDGTTV